MKPGLNNFPALEISEAARRRDRHIKTFMMPINEFSTTEGGWIQDETALMFYYFQYFQF